MSMRVYIGHDDRFEIAWGVAAKTARRFGCDVIRLRESSLRLSGLLTRPLDRRGQMFDFNSNAPQSTEFATTRFWIGILAHEGWCMFLDSDTICCEDPHELLLHCDPDKAVMVVKHPNFSANQLDPVGGPFGPPKKMDGQIQTVYRRKLWSSVMLWNCDHEANQRLNVTALNQWPGRDLHAFKWLADSEIGELPPEANWLVGLQPKPVRPIIAHYTLGTPDLKDYENSEHAALWREAAAA